jgi:hypothetical protein
VKGFEKGSMGGDVLLCVSKLFPDGICFEVDLSISIHYK